MTGVPPLVLIPGVLCTARLFGPQVAALRGLTDITVADHMSHADLPAMARAILAAAPPRFALAGLSMGGYVAFEMIRQAPDRIDRLALLDTNARADRPEQAAQRRDLVRLAEAEGLDRVVDATLPYLIHPDRLSDAALTGTIRDMAHATGLEAFRRQQEAMISRPDNRPLLAAIRCPTLILVGEQDAITPVKVALEMSNAIIGSACILLATCGHLAPLEAPDAVTKALSGWLTAS